MQDHTHFEQAQHIRGLLTEELQTLKLLEEELKGHPVQSIRKRVHLDRVSSAISYLQKCVDELRIAVGE
jgi:histone H3/H4